MTGTAEVSVVRDSDLLAQAVAARLITRLVDAQASRGRASVVLTGGGIGTAVLRAVRRSPARDAVDWGALDVWWGDERYVPAGDSERNDQAADGALLDAVPVDPARRHAMAASGAGLDPDDAAAAYAAALASAAAAEGYGEAVPRFDVLLLGVGPEGHVASVFPEAPAVYEERTVVAVRNCPKPPPTRITLTLPAICAAQEVWLLAAGAEKAPAVALTLGPAGAAQVPAAGARGRSRTLLLLDEAAASRVPRGVRRLASP